mmetsp:Transcript_11879/g.33895  ORF Transcript_11879/g.33895 Transcript_11879/m.33895 type:complete len:117 (+) Transcript_11879:331-681(+)
MFNGGCALASENMLGVFIVLVASWALVVCPKFASFHVAAGSDLSCGEFGNPLSSEWAKCLPCLVCLHSIDCIFCDRDLLRLPVSQEFASSDMTTNIVINGTSDMMSVELHRPFILT